MDSNAGEIRYKTEYKRKKPVDTYVEVKKGNGEWVQVINSGEKGYRNKTVDIEITKGPEDYPRALGNAPYLPVGDDGKRKGRVGDKRSVRFDKYGYPDLTPYSISEAEMTLEPKHWLKEREKQFEVLDMNLYRRIENGDQQLINSLKEKGYTEEDFKKYLAKGRRLPGMTWHHHQEHGRMQLVETDIHASVKHTGGDAIWGVAKK